MTQEMLEMLIGKYLDGQITTSEQHILDAELESNSQARELLKQLQRLDEQIRGAVTSEIIRQGKPAEEIFDQSRQWQTRHPSRRIIKVGGRLRFVAGLAAGLVIGLSLHFVLPARLAPAGYHVQPDTVAHTTNIQAYLPKPTLSPLPAGPTKEVTRNVDWYSFTDEQGGQWLVEGFRENIVRHAADYEGL